MYILIYITYYILNTSNINSIIIIIIHCIISDVWRVFRHVLDIPPPHVTRVQTKRSNIFHFNHQPTTCPRCDLLLPPEISAPPFQKRHINFLRHVTANTPHPFHEYRSYAASPIPQSDLTVDFFSYIKLWTLNFWYLAFNKTTTSTRAFSDFRGGRKICVGSGTWLGHCSLRYE